MLNNIFSNFFLPENQYINDFIYIVYHIHLLYFII